MSPYSTVKLIDKPGDEHESFSWEKTKKRLVQMELLFVHLSSCAFLVSTSIRTRKVIVYRQVLLVIESFLSA